MPILAREPDIYPDNLLDGASPLASEAAPWWALYTLPRREKDLMRRLRAWQVPFYGPVIEQRKRSPQGRVRRAYVPLFPGYVFLCGSEEARHRALTTNCVSRCLIVPDGGRLREICGRFSG